MLLQLLGKVIADFGTRIRVELHNLLKYLGYGRQIHRYLGPELARSKSRTSKNP